MARVLTHEKHQSLLNLLVNDTGLAHRALPLMQAMLTQVKLHLPVRSASYHFWLLLPAFPADVLVSHSCARTRSRARIARTARIARPLPATRRATTKRPSRPGRSPSGSTYRKTAWAAKPQWSWPRGWTPPPPSCAGAFTARSTPTRLKTKTFCSSPTPFVPAFT